MVASSRKRGRAEYDKQADGYATDSPAGTPSPKKARTTARPRITKSTKRKNASELSRKRRLAERHLQELEHLAKESNQKALDSPDQHNYNSTTVCELSLKSAIARLRHAFSLEYSNGLKDLGLPVCAAEKHLKLTKIVGVSGVPTLSKQNWITLSSNSPPQIDVDVGKQLASLDLMPDPSIKSFLDLEPRLLEQQQAGLGPRLISEEICPMQGCGWRSASGAGGFSLEEAALLLQTPPSLQEVFDEVWREFKGPSA